MIDIKTLPSQTKKSNSLKIRLWCQKNHIDVIRVYHGNGFLGVILNDNDPDFDIGVQICRHVFEIGYPSVMVFRYFVLDKYDPRTGPCATLAHIVNGHVVPWNYSNNDDINQYPEVDA